MLSNTFRKDTSPHRDYKNTSNDIVVIYKCFISRFNQYYLQHRLKPMIYTLFINTRLKTRFYTMMGSGSELHQIYMKSD